MLINGVDKGLNYYALFINVTITFVMFNRTPQHFLEDYDTSAMQFNPPLPPKTLQMSKKKAKVCVYGNQGWK